LTAVGNVSGEERHPKYNEFLCACCASHSKAEYLLRTHPELLNAGTGSDETPLHWLAIENWCEPVEFLIGCGADVNTHTQFGATPLVDAAGLELTEMVALLLKAGADPNARCSLDGSALHRVARAKKNRVEIAGMLLDHGGAIELRDNFGNTPLMTAAKEGRVDLVRLLLDRGANPNAKNRSNETVLHLAAESEDHAAEVVEILLKAGADARALDWGGETPYQVALSHGNVAAADVLAGA
jgi:ankyrin repeat protein